jgi:hypothetical protein
MAPKIITPRTFAPCRIFPVDFPQNFYPLDFYFLDFYPLDVCPQDFTPWTFAPPPPRVLPLDFGHVIAGWEVGVRSKERTTEKIMLSYEEREANPISN